MDGQTEGLADDAPSGDRREFRSDGLRRIKPSPSPSSIHHPSLGFASMHRPFALLCEYPVALIGGFAIGWRQATA